MYISEQSNLVQCTFFSSNKPHLHYHSQRQNVSYVVKCNSIGCCSFKSIKKEGCLGLIWCIMQPCSWVSVSPIVQSTSPVHQSSPVIVDGLKDPNVCVTHAMHETWQACSSSNCSESTNISISTLNCKAPPYVSNLTTNAFCLKVGFVTNGPSSDLQPLDSWFARRTVNTTDNGSQWPSTKTNGKPSLKDCLLIGPKLSEDPGPLMKFCLYRITLMADIEKAFPMISVEERDQDVFHFLWLMRTKSKFYHIKIYTSHVWNLL